MVRTFLKNCSLEKRIQIAKGAAIWFPFFHEMEPPTEIQNSEQFP